jgi:hypothetical protein
MKSLLDILKNQETIASTLEQRTEITDLKAQLDATDYKVIKNAECNLAGVELPYDAKELHNERQTLRDKIDELEIEINELS